MNHKSRSSKKNFQLRINCYSWNKIPVLQSFWVLQNYLCQYWYIQSSQIENMLSIEKNSLETIKSIRIIEKKKPQKWEVMFAWCLIVLALSTAINELKKLFLDNHPISPLFQSQMNQLSSFNFLHCFHHNINNTENIGSAT